MCRNNYYRDKLLKILPTTSSDVQLVYSILRRTSSTSFSLVIFSFIEKGIRVPVFCCFIFVCEYLVSLVIIRENCIAASTKSVTRSETVLRFKNRRVYWKVKRVSATGLQERLLRYLESNIFQTFPPKQFQKLLNSTPRNFSHTLEQPTSTLRSLTDEDSIFRNFHFEQFHEFWNSVASRNYRYP